MQCLNVAAVLVILTSLNVSLDCASDNRDHITGYSAHMLITYCYLVLFTKTKHNEIMFHCFQNHRQSRRNEEFLFCERFL